MNNEGSRRRAYYQAKIDEAENLMTKTSDPDALETLNTIAQGYRALLKRLREAPVKH